VSVVDPAYTKTSFDANLLEPDATIDEYREIRTGVTQRLIDLLATADALEVVAEVVLRAARAGRPKVRYTGGKVAGRVRLLRRFAPAGLLDAGLRRDLQLDAVTTAPPRTQLLATKSERP
jgi:hypothetical protein